jgi:hypothetical protein
VVGEHSCRVVIFPLILGSSIGLIVATSQSPASAATCATPWSSTSAYVGGDVVSYSGHNWYAKWWTQGETPGTTGEWGVWSDQGACDTSTPPSTDSVYFQNRGNVEGWDYGHARGRVDPCGPFRSPVSGYPGQ